MTAWTTPRTWTSTTLAAADLNTDVRDNELHLKEILNVSGATSPSALNKLKSARCGVRCTNTADTTGATSTDKTLLWDTDAFDTDGFHSTASNTHRITIPSGLDGDYLFSVQIEFEFNATGDRRVWIEDSAATMILGVNAKSTNGSASSLHRVTLSGVIADCAAADWFAAHYYQDSGATLTAYQSATTRVHFSAFRLFAA